MDPDRDSDADPDADLAIFVSDLQEINKKIFVYCFLEVHFLKIISHKDSRNQCFFTNFA
jgi:hypothetical protein